MMKCLTSTLHMLMDGSQGRQCTNVIVNIYPCLPVKRQSLATTHSLCGAKQSKWVVES